MLLSSGKIPGHSGTDFKPRKGFNKVKSFQENLAKDPATKYKGRNYDRNQRLKDTKVYKGIALGIAILLALTGGVAAGVFGDSVSQVIQYDKEVKAGLAIQKENRESAEKKDAFKILLKDGNNYLQSNQLYEAQIAFERAIKVLPDNTHAYIGLTKTLVAQCHSLRLNCEQAIDYIQYLQEAKILPEQKIRSLTIQLSSI
ncbi:MAG: hypothetical protein GYB31_10555 [Bacteroidetes bacterium]|nr:hypothetical protein [Bacteroidota bacterium]